MSVRDQVGAIRRSVGLHRVDGARLFRFEADAGLAALDPVVATNLQLREAQFRQGLVLDDRGEPIADLLMGPFRGSLYTLVRGELEAGGEPMHETHAAFGIDGPFAWELLGAWDTPAAIGLPYLGAYAPRDDVLVVRAGRTGEYGYLILVPNDQADAVWDDLHRRAIAMEGAAVERPALAHCSLENFVFELDREGRAGLDALELQLTWRLDLDKDAPGLDAIRAHRAGGLRRRLVAIRTPEPVADGAAVICEGEERGRVLASAPDLLGSDGQRVLAVLETPWAHPRMTYRIAERPAETISAPFVLNRSLFVNPQRHAWATRDEIELPPELLWPGSTSW